METLRYPRVERRIRRAEAQSAGGADGAVPIRPAPCGWSLITVHVQAKPLVRQRPQCCVASLKLLSRHLHVLAETFHLQLTQRLGGV